MIASQCQGINNHGSPCAKRVRGKKYCAYHTKLPCDEEPSPEAPSSDISTPESHLLSLVRRFGITTQMILHIQREFDSPSLTYDSADDCDVLSDSSYATRWTVVSRPKPLRAFSIFIGGMALTFALMNQPIISALLTEIASHTQKYLYF